MTPHWKERFEEKFVDKEHSTWRYPIDLDDVESFISTVEAEAFKRGAERATEEVKSWIHRNWRPEREDKHGFNMQGLFSILDQARKVEDGG